MQTLSKLSSMSVNLNARETTSWRHRHVFRHKREIQSHSGQSASSPLHPQTKGAFYAVAFSETVEAVVDGAVAVTPSNRSGV